MKLVKFHIFQRNAASGTYRRAVPRVGMRIGCDLEDASKPAGGKQDGFGGKYMQFAGSQFNRNDTLTAIFRHYQIEDLKFVIKRYIVFNTLLIKGLQNHMPGAIRGIASTTYGCFAKVAGMAAEATLIDASFGGPVKRQSPIFQIIYCLNGFLCQYLGGLLINQIIAAFDSVKGMPFRLVFFHISKCGADATLSCPGVAANGK